MNWGFQNVVRPPEVRLPEVRANEVCVMEDHAVEASPTKIRTVEGRPNEVGFALRSASLQRFQASTPCSRIARCSWLATAAGALSTGRRVGVHGVQNRLC